MCNIIFFVLLVNVEVQTDWVSGPGTLGPVNSWGSAFYQSDSLTYNIQGQISPVATDVNYTAWVKHIIDQDTSIATYNSIVHGDFDNDGDQDLVGVKSLANLIAFYENQNNDTFVQVASYTVPSGYPEVVSANYINNDSLIDVVVSGSGGGVVWFENSGSFNFASHIIVSSGASWFHIAGDIDNDGDIDIVHVSSPDIRVWKNDGFGNFTNTQTFSPNISMWRLRLGDLNGDGSLDLMIGKPLSPPYVVIYFNDGNGNFSYATSISTPGVVDGLWSRDFDNDGDEDILTGIYLRWYENDGTGMNYTEHIVSNIAGYGDGAAAEDMDMDGKADMITGWRYLAFFRQNTPNNFTEYKIDDYGITWTHWVIPFYRGGCFPLVDILVCGYGAFLWYENKMINQFTDSSWLESSVLNSNCDATWLWFGYDVCCPFDSAIAFQFRSGKNLTDITGKPWSPAGGGIFLLGLGYFSDSVALAPFTVNGDTLFQYKVNFIGSQDAPIVYEAWVNWECGGAGVEEACHSERSEESQLGVRGNKVYYSLPRELSLSLALYDISGRLIKLLEKGRKSVGNYVISIPSLRAGIYFISLSSDQGRVVKKLIILH